MRLIQRLLASATAVLLASCAWDRGVPAGAWPPIAGVPTHNLDAAEVADFSPSVDYFPDKAEFRHATQIAVSYHGHFKRARITTSGVGEQFDYVFVQRGTPIPPVSADTIVVPVPVKRYSLGTFRYGRASQQLGLLDRLVAFSNHTHTTVPEILELFDTGVLTRNANTEAILNRRSEAHFNWHFAGRLSRTDDTFARMGVPLVDMAEHLEPTPLARAEWIKFFALFFNKEAQAEALFTSIEARYAQTAALVADVTVRPNVLVGAPNKDGWQVFGGRNVHSRFIIDAGGRYLWDDHTSTESGPTVSFEDGLTRARLADVWLIGPDASFGPRVAEITVDDKRLQYIPAVRNGRVYVEHLNYPAGPNPWWDEALVRPHLELMDHIRILHPERVPGAAGAPFTFFTRLGHDVTR
jgi:iron complex transport system substrate-binding protein